MSILVLYAFASIGVLCVIGFAALLAMVVADRIRQGRRSEPSHKRPRSVSGPLDPNVSA